MYKIFCTTRNRLAITTKFITALRKHSTIPYELYVYDNCTSYKISEHFMYFSLLYEKGFISQYVVNTKRSTFDAFSKAVSCNQFGHNHEMDPNKDKYDFLLFIDNDIIVTPAFDKILKNAWDEINKRSMNDIKIIGQLPGGIKSKNTLPFKISGLSAKTGKCGGSGFWSVRPNFFRDIGYLDIKSLVGHNKKHDQHYWTKLEIATKGKDYILGLDHKLCIHTGGMCGSICNTLTKNKLNKNKNIENLIKFEESDDKIDSMSFDDFYNYIKDNKEMINNW